MATKRQSESAKKNVEPPAEQSASPPWRKKIFVGTEAEFRAEQEKHGDQARSIFVPNFEQDPVTATDALKYLKLAIEAARKKGEGATDADVLDVCTIEHRFLRQRAIAATQPGPGASKQKAARFGALAIEMIDLVESLTERDLRYFQKFGMFVENAVLAVEKPDYISLIQESDRDVTEDDFRDLRKDALYWSKELPGIDLSTEYERLYHTRDGTILGVLRHIRDAAGRAKEGIPSDKVGAPASDMRFLARLCIACWNCKCPSQLRKTGGDKLINFVNDVAKYVYAHIGDDALRAAARSVVQDAVRGWFAVKEDAEGEWSQLRRLDTVLHDFHGRALRYRHTIKYAASEEERTEARNRLYQLLETIDYHENNLTDLEETLAQTKGVYL